MKGIATIALAASTSINGQNVNVIRRDNNPSASKVEGEDTNYDPQNPSEHLDQYQKSENVMQNTPLLLLPEDETSIEKSEIDVGVLSNNKEGVSIDIDNNPRGQNFLDTPQYNQQVTQKGRRRLDDDAAATFQERCVASSLEKFGTDYTSNPLNSYVDCVRGVVNGTTTDETCADACDGSCCTYSGRDACEGFTGKGKQRVIHSYILIDAFYVESFDFGPHY